MMINSSHTVMTLREAFDRIGLKHDAVCYGPLGGTDKVPEEVLDEKVVWGGVISSNWDDRGKLFAFASGPMLYSWSRVGVSGKAAGRPQEFILNMAWAIVIYEGSLHLSLVG